MTELIRKVTSRWCETGIIDAADEDIYIYGLDLLIYTILNITIIMGSATMVGKVSESIALLSVILPLQSFGGGYHAKTHLRCFLIMYIGWWGVIFVLPAITPTAALIMTCLAVVTVYWLAPVAHENVKMSLKQRTKMRKISRVIVSLIASISALLIICQYKRIGVTIATGLGVSSLSMLVAHLKNLLMETHT